jgi:hypothetical protein
MTPGGTNTSAARPPPPPPPRLSHAHDAAHANELSEHSLSALEEELKGEGEGEGEGAPSAPAHPPVAKLLSPGSLSPKLAKRVSGVDGFGDDELAPGRCAAFKQKVAFGAPSVPAAGAPPRRAASSRVVSDLLPPPTLPVQKASRRQRRSASFSK